MAAYLFSSLTRRRNPGYRRFLQHFPHCVHLKSRPSSYQGSCVQRLSLCFMELILVLNTPACRSAIPWLTCVAMTVSIIIPTLNEATCIADDDPCTQRLPPEPARRSLSPTAAAPTTRRSRAVRRRPRHRCPAWPRRPDECRRRPRYRRAPAVPARRLHAGGRRPLRAIARPIAAPAAAHRAGCFSMRVDAEGTLFRSINASATARVRLTGIAHGDQGLILRRRQLHATRRLPTAALHGRRVLQLRRLLPAWPRRGAAARRST